MASNINADNGVVSGSAGLKTSADSTGVLALQTNGTTAVTVETTGRVSIGTTTAATTNAMLTIYNPNATSSQIYLQNTGTGTGSSNGFRLLMSATDVYMTNKENGPIIFETNDTERGRIPETGGIQSGNCVSVGNATPSTSGAGITFPAIQSASSNVNTLDDYEEGTWTPNQGAGLTLVGTFSSDGRYTKIGNIVSVQGYVKGSTNISCLVGGLICTNMPFIGISVNFLVSGSTINWDANSNSSCALQGATTNLYNGTAITASDRISFQVTYQVG